MKYYLIAGEASGDLHASHLMASLKRYDREASFRCIGGDMMCAQGGELLMHYKDLAYMGIIPVVLHARTILRGMARCREDILQWRPDVVILVDYPGFNLKIARFVKDNTHIPVHYYISPKIWAWKEYRIRDIRRYVDEMFSILPFEKEFYEGRHGYPIHYVGNPTLDEVRAFQNATPVCPESFRSENGLDGRPIIAILAGSRRQEISDNLLRMMEAAEPYAGTHQLVLAAAPGIDDDFYMRCTKGKAIAMLRGKTFQLLSVSEAALVTSGTATLETALFRVPQVVCYYMKAGVLASLARRVVLKIPYISLVNLVAGKEVVPELVAHQMTVRNVRSHLGTILPGGTRRQAQLDGYSLVAERLGNAGAPGNAARLMLACLGKKP